MTAAEDVNGGRLQVAAAVLKAAGMALLMIPSAMYRLTLGHRRFGQCFVQEAVSYGIPESAAREIVHALRPRALLRELKARQKEEDKA